MTTTSTLLTVSEFTFHIKHILESRFPVCFIQGEISNFKPHSTGHYYFDLKDAQAKIPAVMFKGTQANLPRLPKEGDLVRVKASLSVYPPQGKYQLVVKELQFAGLGELLLKLEELKKKLKDLGWFEKERKKSLPEFPKRIGIITSPTGAVIKDMIHVLSRRHSSFKILLNPVKVQGDGAAQEIAKAIEHFNHHALADVLIVGRGGGSLEDLWAFNEEVVASAIYHSRIPIISAVGHETDFTLADFVADVRAPTPSAAAEIVMKEKLHYIHSLSKTHQTLRNTLYHFLKRYQEKLQRFMTHPLIASPYALLGNGYQRLDEIKTLLSKQTRSFLNVKKMHLLAFQKQTKAMSPHLQILQFRERCYQYQKRNDLVLKQLIQWKKEKLKQIVLRLNSLDPKNVLKRGYSILFAQKEGSVIVSAHEMQPGKKVRALFSDGEAFLAVEEGKK